MNNIPVKPLPDSLSIVGNAKGASGCEIAARLPRDRTGASVTVTPTQAAAQMGLTAPRVAVIFNGSGNWHFWARLAIHAATQTWGGQNFILIPHDGGYVDPVLLQAARAYDPDYVVRLQATVHQFERAEPGRLKYRDGSGELILGEDRERLLGNRTRSPGDHPAGQLSERSSGLE